MKKKQARSDVDFFFDVPTTWPSRHPRNDGTISLLYLLRREAQETFFGHIRPESTLHQQTGRHRGFATLLVLMAGIDLMGKFASGQDDLRSANSRFQQFAACYMGMTANQAEALYKVRCCLMHSFGLYDPVKNDRIAIAVQRRWREPGENPVEHDEPSGYWILKIESTYQAFLDGVALYEAEVRSGRKAAHFAAIFPKYGWTHYGPG